MTVGVGGELESSKTVDPFVKTPTGFFRKRLSRNPPHCTLICSVGYSAGRIPATPVQVRASWKTPKAVKSPPSRQHWEGPRPDPAGWDTAPDSWAGARNKDPSQGVLFSWGIGGGRRSRGGGHFPARNPSRCRGEEAERKHKSVSSGPSKLAPVFAERSGSSASGTNGS